MNRTLKNGCVLVSLVAVLGGGAWFAKARHDASAVIASRTPLSFSWQRGTRYLYDLEWTVRSQSKVDMTGGAGAGAAGQTPADAAGVLKGQLAFKSYGKQGESWLFGVSVEALQEAKLEAMGNNLFAEPSVVHDTFDGREAFVEVGPRGDVQHLRFRAGDPPLFKQLLQSVIAESQVVLSGAPDAHEWQSAETYAVGKLEMHYAADRSDPLLLRRTPSRILALGALPTGVAGGATAQLGGGSDVHLDSDGFVRSIETRVDVTIAPVLEHHTTFTMKFLSLSDFDVPEHLALDSLAPQIIEPGAAPPAPELRQRMDERFAARTSQAGIEGLIAGSAKGRPPMRGAVTAAAAFLRLHPEGCEALAAHFLDPELGTKSRELMMDLLASAGSPAAQSAMRRGLEAPETRADLGGYGRMIQRMGFVAAPTRDSVEYVAALYDSPGITADADLRRVTGLTLGAMSGHATGGSKALGDSIHTRLVAEMKAARTSEEKIGLVAAVGNAAKASDLPVLRDVAKSEDRTVRESVARALRGIDSPETRTTLREMLTDPSAEVARAAAFSYETRPLTGSDMAGLASLVTNGTVNAGADASVVGVVQAHMDSDKAASQQILEAVLARNPDGPGAGQLRLLLRRLRGDV